MGMSMVCAGYVESSCLGCSDCPAFREASSCPGGIATAKGKANRPAKKMRMLSESMKIIEEEE